MSRERGARQRRPQSRSWHYQTLAVEPTTRVGEALGGRELTDYRVGAGQKRPRHRDAKALAVVLLMTNSNRAGA